MKILFAILLYTLLFADGTKVTNTLLTDESVKWRITDSISDNLTDSDLENKELNTDLSLEGKIYGGIKPNFCLTEPLFFNPENLRLLIVQIVKLDLTPICTGIRLSPFLIIISSSCIKPYKVLDICLGILVKFQENFYHVLKCGTRGETTNEEDKYYGKDHYNDIGVLYVNLGWGPQNMNLLAKDDQGYSEGSIAFLLGWNKNTPKVQLFNITQLGRTCVKQKPKEFDTNRIFCAKSLDETPLEEIDIGSPLILHGRIIGTVSGRFRGYGIRNETVFSSIFGHYDYIESVIERIIHPPFIPGISPCVLQNFT